MTDAGLEGYKVFNSLVLPLPPGVYSARLTIIDAVSKAQGEAFYDRIVVEPPRAGSLALGGKCLAYDITYVGDTLVVPANRMPKNGFDVICNPLGVFSTEDTAMYLYAEVYNLGYDPGNASRFRLSYTALDRFGKVAREFGTKERTKPGESAVIAEEFDITDFPTGHYELRIVATDLVNEQADTARMDFAIVAPYSASLVSADLDAGFIDPYDSLSLKEKQNLVYYMLTPVEKKTLEQLEDKGKEEFLRRYWQERDEDPTTRVIENRLEMIRRYQYANENFSTTEEKTDGWFSDRGRIYMTYGPWEDMDDIQHPQGGNPYQVWHYYSVREGAVFVFEDKRGFEDYQLTHSNVEGEVFSSYWNEILKFDYYKQD
jgi:GWxTD domain-containing protein